MKIINVREFRKNISHYIENMYWTEEPLMITKHGASYVVLITMLEYVTLKKIAEDYKMSQKERDKKRLRFNMKKYPIHR